MRIFTIFWLDGKKEEVRGEGKTQIAALADACRRAGIGVSAVRAINYFVEQHSHPAGKPPLETRNSASK